MKCYAERVGIQTLLTLPSFKGHVNPAQWHEMFPLPWRDTKRLQEHQETEEGWRRNWRTRKAQKRNAASLAQGM